jgi:hypothetical protein
MMTVLNSLSLKRFMPGREVAAAERSPSDGGQLPIPGYDRIKDKDLIADLSKHTQAELAAIETYERSHEERPAVFDKLRYLRGPEPLEGYDALSAQEISAGLEGADTVTLKRTRLYERKFRRRHDVLEEVETAIHDRNPSVHRG